MVRQQSAGARRRWWQRLHRWFGVSIGLVFALAGLTGAVLVFYVELDAWANPQIAPARSCAHPRSVDEVLAALHDAHPQRTGAWRIELPMTAARPYMARFMKPAESAGRAFAPLVATVDPCTLAVTSSRVWGSFAMTWIYDLHYSLLLERNGRWVLGITGALVLISIVSGLVLWWPRTPPRHRVLRLVPRPGRVRATWDVHWMSGVYGLVVLLPVLSTGILLALPEWLNPVIDRASPLQTVQVPTLDAPIDAPPTQLSLDAALAIGQRQFPDAEPRWIETPANAQGTIFLRMHQPHEPSRRFPRSLVWIAPYSGEIVAVRDPRANGAGDTLLAWLHPLHNGEAFGLAGRIAVVVSGLVPPVLLVTGLMRWRQRTDARRRADTRPRRHPTGVVASGTKRDAGRVQ